jgi:hypothetical protein
LSWHGRKELSLVAAVVLFIQKLAYFDATFDRVELGLVGLDYLVDQHHVLAAGITQNGTGAANTGKKQVVVRQRAADFVEVLGARRLDFFIQLGELAGDEGLDGFLTHEGSWMDKTVEVEGQLYHLHPKNAKGVLSKKRKGDDTLISRLFLKIFDHFDRKIII